MTTNEKLLLASIILIIALLNPLCDLTEPYIESFGRLILSLLN